MKKSIITLSICIGVLFIGCAKSTEDIMFTNIENNKSLTINKKCSIQLDRFSEGEEIRKGRTTIQKYSAYFNDNYLDMTLYKFSYDSSVSYLDSEGYFEALKRLNIKIVSRKNKNEVSLVTVSNADEKYHLVSRGISKLIVLASNSSSFYDVVSEKCLK